MWRKSLVNPTTSSTSGVQWNHEPAVVSSKTPLVLLRRRVGKRNKRLSSIVALEPTELADDLDPSRG